MMSGLKMCFVMRVVLPTFTSLWILNIHSKIIFTKVELFCYLGLFDHLVVMGGKGIMHEREQVILALCTDAVVMSSFFDIFTRILLNICD